MKKKRQKRKGVGYVLGSITVSLVKGVSQGFIGGFIGSYQIAVDWMAEEKAGCMQYPSRSLKRYTFASKKADYLSAKAGDKPKEPGLIAKLSIIVLFSIIFCPFYVVYGTFWQGPAFMLRNLWRDLAPSQFDQDMADAKDEEAPTRPKIKRNKPFVLIVDDDPLIRENLQKIVDESEKYHTMTASNGLMGLKTMIEHITWAGMTRNDIACVILDVKMPEINGIDCLKMWRKKEGKFFKIPVILLTAYESDSIWRDATHSQTGLVATYLKKPVKKLEVLDLLHKIIFNKEQQYLREITKEKRKQRFKSQMEAWQNEESVATNE